MEINCNLKNTLNCQPIKRPYDKANNNNSCPSFGSMHKTVKDSLGNITNRTNSWFFRLDLNWDKVTDYIINTFPNGGKIRNFACSDGSEPFSLAMSLIDKLGDKEAQKYFPILARDIDKDALDIAQNGALAFGPKDRGMIKHFLTKTSFDDYFTQCMDESQYHKYHGCPTWYFKPTKKLADSVHFAKGDILNYIAQPQLDADVLFSRNFIPYLSPTNQYNLLTSLNKKMKPKSLFCVGDFDYSGDYGTGYKGAELLKKELTNFTPLKWLTLQGNEHEAKHFIHN